MSANHRVYEDYLNYFPEKERKAVEELLELEENTDNMAIRVAEHVDRQRIRSNTRKPAAKKPVLRA